MEQMSNKKANIAISENNKLIVTQNSRKKCERSTTSTRLHMAFPELSLLPRRFVGGGVAIIIK